MVIDRLGLECGQPDMSEWDAFVDHSASLADEVHIALVGKYVQLPDAYLSVNESLDHAGIFHDHKVNVQWVDAESLTPEEVDSTLVEIDGILVPGGFGIRGIEGKIRAARFARENKVPYLGICLGMQVAVVEFARHVAGLEGANSAEFDPVTPHPVIDLMRDQHEVADMGGTMRLGAYPCKVAPETKGCEAYGEEVDLRAPPPPLRGEQRLPAAAAGRRTRHQRPEPRRQAGRDGRAPGPPVVPRQPGPPRVQEPAHAAGAALP